MKIIALRVGFHLSAKNIHSKQVRKTQEQPTTNNREIVFHIAKKNNPNIIKQSYTKAT